MKKAIFTIVAKNYIGLAKILNASLIDKDVDFFIVVADELNNTVLEDNIIVAKNKLNYTEEQWINLTFKYNLTEFCTAIKPSSFKYLASLGYDSIIYMDPDIEIYESLNYIFDLLYHNSLVLTPHFAECHVNYNGQIAETDLLLNGIYNLGFIAISIDPTSLKFLDWWQERLNNHCFSDKSKGYFTDQKWMDFAPSFPFSKGVYISHHLGMNLAPWNYFERRVIKIDDHWFVESRKERIEVNKNILIFSHFSGFKYKLMASGKIARQDRQGTMIKEVEYGDIDLLVQEYTEEIRKSAETFNQYIDLNYSYACFDNGQPIDRFHRRLYNGLVEEGYKIENPFATGKGSFYEMLVKANLVSDKSNISPDKITASNIQGLGKKKKIFALLFKMMKRLIGYKNYVLFTRALPNYYRPEEHTFLLNKKMLSK